MRRRVVRISHIAVVALPFVPSRVDSPLRTKRYRHWVRRRAPTKRNVEVPGASDQNLVVRIAGRAV